MKLKKGDEIKVVRGKDKGKTGKIDRVFAKEAKVLVAGVNLYKKNKKARTAQEKSEIITITRPLPLANVQLICPKCHVLTRVGFSIENGEKKRICKKCDQTL
jgi:large subunit ribosomal protein L24